MALIFYVFYIFNIIAWLYYLKSRTQEPGFFIYLFPIKFLLSKATSVSYKVISMLIVYIEIMVLYEISMKLSYNSNVVYIIFFTVILIYELLMLTKINSLLLGKRFHFPIVFITLSLFVLYAAVMCFITKDFQLINIVDFWTMIVKLALSILIIQTIIVKRLIKDEIETFFIIVGFAIFFALLMLASGFLLGDYLEEWHFVQLSTLLVLSIWFWSSLWAWKFIKL